MRDTHDAKPADSRRPRTCIEAGAILEQYRQSGLTQRVFARRIGIAISTLQYWMRREERARAEQIPRKAGSAKALPVFSLLEVELAGPPVGVASGDARYEIEWRSGVRLRLPKHFGDGEVRRLLLLLKEVR